MLLIEEAVVTTWPQRFVHFGGAAHLHCWFLLKYQQQAQKTFLFLSSTQIIWEHYEVLEQMKDNDHCPAMAV